MCSLYLIHFLSRDFNLNHSSSTILEHTLCVFQYYAIFCTLNQTIMVRITLAHTQPKKIPVHKQQTPQNKGRTSTLKFSKLLRRHKANLWLCNSCRFGVMLMFSYEFTLYQGRGERNPLKQKSLKCSSQESWCTLSNKHSMTNPSSQMTRPSHLTHNDFKAKHLPQLRLRRWN